MSYEDIFILGWNLNAVMFVINFLVAIFVIKSNDPSELKKQNEVLENLKQEFDIYYPNRKYETLLSYLIPFTAFFRVGYRLFEMSMFFIKNKGSGIFDYMVYKYTNDINRAKAKLNR